MKKTFIAQILFVCLFLVSGNAFAASGASINAAKGCSPENKDFIIIVDVMSIGSGGPQLYTDRCVGFNNAGITSGQTITLPQADPSMSNIVTQHFAFHPLMASPGNFIEFWAWVNCDGNIYFADITPWGGNWAVTPIMNMKKEIIEVQLSIPGSAVLIRLIEMPGGAVKVIMTASEGVHCLDGTYPVDCTDSFERGDATAGGIITTSNTLQVAPNPFTTSFESILTLQQDGEVNVAMYDLMGKEVGTESFTGKAGANQFTINTEDLPSGVYLLAVQTGDERLVRKVVKK